MYEELLDKENVNAVYRKGQTVIVQVSEKLPLSELDKKDVVPKTVEGLKTDVVEKGQIHLAEKYRPLIGGISCMESNLGAGTLGAIVRDKSDGNLVGLTCNHCAGTLFDIEYTWPAYGNNALSHIKMYQPSPNDGGGPADSLGAPIRAIATQFGPLGDNLVDAAIINIPLDLAKTDIRKIHRGPFSFIENKQSYDPGKTVYKTGRTTGLTQGTIVSTNVSLSALSFFGDEVRFSNQIMVQGDGFAISGDSGSVIVGRFDGIWKIIGLFFASNETDQAFANHIIDVANLLNIEAWNGNVVVDSTAGRLMASGKCYKYKGTSLNPYSHTYQREYLTCAGCANGKYPLDKVQSVS